MNGLNPINRVIHPQLRKAISQQNEVYMIDTVFVLYLYFRRHSPEAGWADNAKGENHSVVSWVVCTQRSPNLICMALLENNSSCIQFSNALLSTGTVHLVLHSIKHLNHSAYSTPCITKQSYFGRSVYENPKLAKRV